MKKYIAAFHSMWHSDFFYFKTRSTYLLYYLNKRKTFLQNKTTVEFLRKCIKFKIRHLHNFVLLVLHRVFTVEFIVENNVDIQQ